MHCPTRSSLVNAATAAGLFVLAAAAAPTCSRAEEKTKNTTIITTESASGASVSSAAPVAPSAAPPEAQPVPITPITWTGPPSWTKQPPSNEMRIAQYLVPHVADDAVDAECVVSRFGGGSVNENVDRWIRQFDPATTQPFSTWADHAEMSPEQKAARPPLQALLPPLKPALIFECVGIPGVLQQLFEGAPRDARIVVVGVCMETDRNEPMLGIIKELNVQYVLGYTPDEFAASLRLIAEGEVDAGSLVTASVGIDGVAQAFADLANPERHTKIIVEPWR